MKPTIFILLLLVSDLLTNAQTDTIPQNSKDSSSCAWLYVYRPKSFVGAAIGYDLHMDDSVICRIKNNSKYAIPLVKEGKTEIWAKSEQKVKFVINVKCGKTYYIKCGIKMGIIVGRPEMSMVAPEQGEVEYESVKGRD